MKKQAQGELTVTSDPRALPGTMFNPLQSLSMGPGTVYLPAFMRGKNPQEDEKRALLFHVLALTGSYGGIGLATGYLNSMFTSRLREKKREGALRPSVEASYVPLLQQDVLAKTAQIADTTVKKDWFYYGLVLPWTAAAVGIAGGLSLGNSLYAAEREQELDDQIKDNAAALDKLTMERLQWARKQAQEKDKEGWRKKFGRIFGNAVGDLGAVGIASLSATFGLSALATYIIARKRDPEIARYKLLEQGFGELTRSQARRTASTIRPLPPELETSLDSIAAGKPRPEIPVTTVEAVPVDATDQSMQLL